MNEEDRQKLYECIFNSFNLEELKRICFLLAIESDEIQGDTRSDKAIELISYCERRAILPKLLSLVRTLRPHLDLPLVSVNLEEERRLFQNFWQHSEGNPNPLYCAFSIADKKNTGEYIRRMTGFGEIMGYASITYSLARAYDHVAQDTEIFFGDIFPQRILQRDSLIILGGDDVNPVTNKILQRIEKKYQRELPFSFDYAPTNWLKIQDPVCGNLIPQKEGGEIVVDYGVVARLPHPYDDKKLVYLFAGCHTYGTAGAAKVVAVKSIMRKIECHCQLYDFNKNKYFIMLIKCTVKENTLYVERMEAFYPLKNDSLEVLSSHVVREIVF